MSESALHNHAPNVATTMCPACLHEGGLMAQRAKQGFCDEDVWGLDTYLAKVISGGVARLREMDTGHPGELEPDEWRTILDKIARGFASYAASDELGSKPERHEVAESDEFKESFDLLQEWWGHLWD